MPINIITGLSGLLIAGTIFYLIRKDHLHVRYSVWWLLLTAPIAALGIFPEVNDKLGATLGVAYPPILPVIGAILFLLVRALTADIELSKKAIRINRLIQRMAILEQELNVLKSESIDKSNLDEGNNSTNNV